MNYVITKNKEFFNKIGKYNFCDLNNMLLPKRVAIDTETTGLDFKVDNIFSIQIGTGSNNYLIDLQEYKDTSLILQLKEVIPFIKNKQLVFHNSAFDLKFFFKEGYWLTNIFDTMLASMVLHNGDGMVNSHSFKECMFREINQFYDKTEQANIATVKLSTKTSIDYCFKDVDRLLELHDTLVQKCIKEKLIKAYVFHCKHIRALTYTEMCGLPISTDKWSQKIKLDENLYEEHKKKVISYIYDNLPEYRDNQLRLFEEPQKRLKILLTSPQQLIPVFKKLGINTKVVEKGVEKESIDKKVISKSKHEFVNLWLNLKEVEHNLSTFGITILEKVINGRLYTNFKPIIDTARIASRKGEINFLNFPANKETRDCFVANEEFKMIVSDYDGQETRTGADITNDPVMIQSIVDDLDLHCAFARMLFPELKDLTDEDIIKNHKAKRNASKAPRFCFQFGGTGYTLAQNEGMTVEEGMKIESLFKQLHSGVYTYGSKKLEESLKTGYITYTYGFRLKLPFFDKYLYLKSEVDFLTKDKNFWSEYKEGKSEYLLKKDNPKYVIKNNLTYSVYKESKDKISELATLRSNYLRLCMNAPTQGTAAFQTKQATILLFKEIEKNNDYWNARISNLVHDEIVLEVKDNLADKYSKILENSMIVGGQKFIKNPLIKMSCKANIGKSWYEAK
jgi:DNA polymerase I-like protein with 3'-5' exonuclease and polymerase domains